MTLGNAVAVASAARGCQALRNGSTSNISKGSDNGYSAT
jgi:hypothetical protein